MHHAMDLSVDTRYAKVINKTKEMAMSSIPWRDMTEEQKQKHREQVQRYRDNHKEQIAQTNKAYWDSHPDLRRQHAQTRRENHRGYYRQASKRNYAKLKQEAITLLGGICVRCGWDDMRCLEIDHIIPVKGDRSVYGIKLYRSIVTGGSRENLQVLCANCHAIKTYEDGNGEG